MLWGSPLEIFPDENSIFQNSQLTIHSIYFYKMYWFIKFFNAIIITLRSEDKKPDVTSQYHKFVSIDICFTGL